MLPTPHQQREAIKRRDRGEPLREITRGHNVHHGTITPQAVRIGTWKAMGKKHIHRKPTGDTGATRVTNVAGMPVVEWRKISLPAEKAAQEMSIAKAFLEALNAQELDDRSSSVARSISG